MFRFSIDDDNWMLRFSPHIQVDQEEKDVIADSIILMGSGLHSFSHGESFVIMNDLLGLIVFHVEKIPSLILTVSTIVSKDKWFLQTDSGIYPYTK